MHASHCTRLAAFAAAVALELGLMASGAQAAQNKAFIDLNGSSAPVKGETSMTKSGWIEVTSFSWGVSRGSTPGSASSGAGAGKMPMGSTTDKESLASGAGAGKVTNGGAGAGKVTLGALNVTLTNQADEQKLMEAAIDGKIIPTIELADYKVTAKGMVPVYNVTFKEVKVTSIDWSGANDKPSANVSLAYLAVEVDANTKASKTDDPTVPAGWNRVTNTVDLSGTPP